MCIRDRYLRVRLHEPEIFSQKQTELSTQKISKLESFKLLVKDKATTKVSLGVVVDVYKRQTWLR